MGKKRKDHIETETARQQHRDTEGETHREGEREVATGEERQAEVKIQRGTRSMKTNSNAVKSVEQQENVNIFPFPTAFSRGGGRPVNNC